MSPGMISDDLKRTLYRNLRLVRRVEEEIARIYPTDKIKSPVHLSIGQEAVSVGVCAALRQDDVVAPTYRCHAAYLSKGGNLSRMFAELYGRATGCSGGKGGSMHLIDTSCNVLGASAVVATTIPIAAGYALALQKEGCGRIVACFFGDGAVDEGVFYESLNFAVLKRLPMLFVCENNSYAIHTHFRKRWGNDDLCARVRGFGLPATLIPESNVFAIHGHALDQIRRLRNGEGPSFLECRTYRWREHVGPGEDYQSGYRDLEELLPWKQADAVEIVGGLLEPAERKTIDDDIERDIASAVQFAEDSPYPEKRELFHGIFAS